MTDLRAAPGVLLCALALVLVACLAAAGGGFEAQAWAPAGIGLLGLLAVAVLAVPTRWAAVPRPAGVAVVALAAYTGWSFLSVTWAADPGAAWEGASRTLLYAATFALFALWPQRPRTAALLLVAWGSLVAVAGLVVGLRLAGGDSLGALLADGRLRSPTGYPNATAALLLMPVVPAVVLAASRAVPWWSRAALAAGAVLLGALALLTVSRGAVFGSPIVLVALLVLVPDRLRHFWAVVVLVLGVGVCAPRMLDVRAAVEAGRGGPAVDRALLVVLLAAMTVGALTAALARVDQRRPADGVEGRRVARGALWAAVALVAVALVGGLVAVGDPVQRVDSAWTSFKGGYAEGTTAPTANRLAGGFGSARYDFYRVGLRTFVDHPVGGIGADNFFQQYLRAGASAETPRYPHSIEVRTLLQTGVVGAVLLLVALGAALVAAGRAARTGDPLGRAVAAGATMVPVYWLVHGSVDWFWEWPVLGIPAFAFLGLACALLPRRQPTPAERERRVAPRMAVAGLVALLAVPLVGIWAADHEQRRAATTYARDPLGAYAQLDRAARLNPFSGRPDALAGSIALRYGDLPRADQAFARVLRRVPNDQYATLERGAIASATGRRTAARRMLERAAALAPRDALARETLAQVRDGGTIDVAVLNQRILDRGRAFAG